MDFNYLADLLYPAIKTYPEDMEKRYPRRVLPEGAKVTRFAPSPTGLVHFGSLFPTRVSERLAHQSGGIFYLRIEDTDSKREVPGAVENLIAAYKYYGMEFDEGATVDGDRGDYGPYRQSQRVEIYQTYCKELVRQGKAYPCFCTETELDAIRAEQEKLKLVTGYWGKWAVWRDADIEAIEAKLREGVPFTLRFRSEGNSEHKLKFEDLVKGTVEVTENDIDHVLLKSDGVPTYHLAHAVDDHLMGTTHVVRGEEWLPSLPLHIQLFKALGFRLPKYLHISQLMKLEGGSKKKLSKRDNETGLDMYREAGYAPLSVVEYIMTLLNSNYEEWRAANPGSKYTDFPFAIKKMSPSGCLLDIDKLNDVSRNTVAAMTADEVFRQLLGWAKEFDADFAGKLEGDPEYAKAILSIGRGSKNPRKDIAVWSEAKPYMSLFYDDYFTASDLYPGQFPKSDVKAALEKFIETYDASDDSDKWFGKVKNIAQELGYAPETKLYKKDPAAYKGHVGDISMFLRIAVTGSTNSPDMYEVMKILGYGRVMARIKSVASRI